MPGVREEREAVGEDAAHHLEDEDDGGEDERQSQRALAGLSIGAELVDGLAARFGRELGGKPLGVATGGLAGVVARHCRSIREIVPDLTLEGLRLLFEMNCGMDKSKIKSRRSKKKTRGGGPK